MNIISFNDKLFLTEKVLKGEKTQTLQICNIKNIDENTIEKIFFQDNKWVCQLKDGNIIDLDKKSYPQYKLNHIVAIAQTYKELGISELSETAGWYNKKFVKSSLMDNKIFIKEIQCKKLNELTDEDYTAEGVSEGRFGQYILKYFDTSHTNCFGYNTKKAAFLVMLKLCFNNEIYNKNPFVWVYNFELTKKPNKTNEQ